MNNFIRNIKKHRIAALICLAVLLIGIIVAAVMLHRDSTAGKDTIEKIHTANTEEYFTDTETPVYTSTSGQNLLLSIEGAAGEAEEWSTEVTPTGLVFIGDKREEKDGDLTFTISPVSTGYTTLILRKSGETAGLTYDKVRITADLVIYNGDDGVLHIRASELRKDNGSSGATDSDTPYVLDGNRVIMPNGGDWTLAPENADALPEGFYRILPGTDENGHSYFDVTKDTSKLTADEADDFLAVLNSVLLLKSESLGVTKKLDCIMNDNRQWILVEAEE